MDMTKTGKRLAALTGAAVLTAVAAAVAGTNRTPASAEPSPTVHVSADVEPSTGSGQSIVDWNRKIVSILQTPGAQPATVHPTRSYAIVHAAIYDAVVSITHADRPYLFEVNAADGARPDAAADQAAHDTLAALYPAMRSSLDDMLAKELEALPTGPRTQDGISVGRTTAALMLAARADDGSSQPPPPFTVPPAKPGSYQITPPNHPAPVFTHWGSITPFVLSHADQFRPAAPPALASDAWAQAINEVQGLGRDTSTTRTADETTAAKFWAPPIWNTWNEIADDQASARHSDLESTAKMFADLNLTVADTTIALYDAKYHYLFWRPITAIRAGTPGNDAVVADPTWNALTNTAADPSYPGAHSSISQAAATVLSDFFGRNARLTVRSDGLPGVTRQFSSFQAAATEAGLSRIFAGQHTRLDHEAGVGLGASVAHFVLDGAEAPAF
jgi:membrane-associated phospholipid phosphatase